MLTISTKTEQHETSADTEVGVEFDRDHEEAIEENEENDIDEVKDLVKSNSRRVEE